MMRARRTGGVSAHFGKALTALATAASTSSRAASRSLRAALPREGLNTSWVRVPVPVHGADSRFLQDMREGAALAFVFACVFLSLAVVVQVGLMGIFEFVVTTALVVAAFVVLWMLVRAVPRVIWFAAFWAWVFWLTVAFLMQIN